jgi:hypothetical protein
MCEKLRCLLRDFSKRRWESAPFADFHGRGIFHQAVRRIVDTHARSTQLKDYSNCFSESSAAYRDWQNGALS